MQLYENGSGQVVVINNTVGKDLQVYKNGLPLPPGGTVAVDGNDVGENLQVYENGDPMGSAATDVTVNGNEVGKDLQVMKNADTEVKNNTNVPMDGGKVQCKDNRSLDDDNNTDFEEDECDD